MDNYVNKKIGKIKIGWFILLLLGVFIYPNDLYSQQQDTIISQVDSLKMKPLPPIERDTIKGFFNKIGKYIKFKENKKLKREAQIHKYLDSLIDEGDLRVDSINLNLMIAQINEAFLKDSIALTKNRSDIEFSKSHLDALEIEMDWLDIRMDMLRKALSLKYLREKEKLNDSIETSLKDISKVHYTIKTINKAPIDSLEVNNVKYFFKKYLKAKNDKQIIGWHNAWNDIEYKNYNYDYLTSINLYGYNLGSKGECKNEKDLIEFQKELGVIDYANKMGCDVTLTVYTKDEKDINKFLNSSIAQSNLIKRLESLIYRKNLKGVNIYFESIPKRDNLRFVQFMNYLHTELNRIDESIHLNLTIPSIYNTTTLERAGTYDFIVLNEMVDYYLVSTDRMTSHFNNWAQSLSPLYDVDDIVKGSIESTFNFYSNGKIPKEKLIMTVSYLGLIWDVLDAQGRVLGNRAEAIEYRKIMKNFVGNRDLSDIITQTYDAVQVASLINLNKSIYQNRQIWFDNSRSLGQKYQWSLDQKIGGVAIRGLGYDDGYTELWDVLGTTLFEIDTVGIKEEIIDNFYVKEKNYICSYEELKDSKSILSFEEMKWSKIVESFQPFVKRSDSVKKDYNLLEKIYSDVQWASISGQDLVFKTDEFKKYEALSANSDQYKYLLNDEETCICLLDRWVYYYHISGGLAILILIIGIVFFLRIKWLIRFNHGGKNIQRFLKGSIAVLSLLFIVLVIFWAFMNPNFEEFGASNNGNVGILIYIVPSVIGIGLGIFLKKTADDGKYIGKNMP